MLRHSTATRVWIRCDATGVEVLDDGGPARPTRGDGSGLRTLASDLASLGGALESGPTSTGFGVRLHVRTPTPTADASAVAAGEAR